MDYKNYYPKKKVKDLGFSEKLIKELLPEPLLEKNPHHNNAKPIKLWEKKVVKEAMKRKEFKEYQISRQHRSFAMKKAAELKRNAIKSQIIEILKNLKIKAISEKDLIIRTLRYYRWRTKSNVEWSDISETKKKKFQVNTIRHELTNYNEIYKLLKGKVGREYAYIYLKEQILKLTAITYPFLEEECSRQILALRINSNENKKLILEKAREYGNNI